MWLTYCSDFGNVLYSELPHAGKRFVYIISLNHPKYTVEINVLLARPDHPSGIISKHTTGIPLS